MIQIVGKQDVEDLAKLAALLWPHHTVQEMAEEIAQTMEQSDAAFFLAWEEKRAVGFAQCQLRHDYVEGTECSPVGYLEGIYVRPEYRGRGIAKALLAACESWAKSRGAEEFASDCELDNEESLKFHLKVGFLEANRIICFAKRL